MKKILFASTALVAAGMMTAGAASASQKIKLELGGFSKWWVVGQFGDNDYTKGVNATQNNAGADYNNVDVKGDNEIFFGGETTLDNGMKVGIMIELEAGGNTETTTAADVIDKNYVYLETAFGKFIVGNEANGTALLHVMGPDAAGNIDSDGIITGGFAVTTPGNVTTKVSTSIDTDGEADKITYVAPTFYGLTLGASYIPNSTAEARGVTDIQSATTGEIFGVGGLYANTFGPVGFKLSGGWVTYDIEAGVNGGRQTTTNPDQKTGVTEWSTGTQLTYGNFTLGGSFRKINGDEALGTNGAGEQDGTAWDAGIMYATGPWAVSFYTFNVAMEGDQTVAADDKTTIYQVSGKYTLGAGVDALASIGHVNYDDETAKASNGDANHNSGWAVMTGLGLTF